VYNVFVTITRLFVPVALGVTAECALSTSELLKLGTAGGGIFELLCTIVEELCAADPTIEEFATAVILNSELVGLALGDIRPGWLNPGRPVEFPGAALLVTLRVEEPSSAPETLSWGVYVKDGKLVNTLSGPLSTGVCELAGGAGLGAPEERMVLILEGGVAWLDDGEGIEDALGVASADDEVGCNQDRFGAL
jgi:hypothetical protein